MRYRIWSLLSLPVLGCGSEFSTASMQSEGLGGTASTSAITSATGGSMATGGSSATTEGGNVQTIDSPCGPLRNDTAAANVELCVPAGTFVMGSQSANLGAGHADHTPPHQVTLSAFVIDAFEVTVGRYRACVVAGQCALPSNDATHGCTYDGTAGSADGLPISCVTAAQAELFCARDDNRRLPTEAEWERTARGTDERLYPWGAVFTCNQAVAAATAVCASAHDGIAVVGSLASGMSPVGAHDMAGNVAEWVKDFASSYPTSAVTDPTGPTLGVSRIVRGGSYSSIATHAQTFVRLTTTSSAIGAFGFRCARSVAY